MRKHLNYFTPAVLLLGIGQTTLFGQAPVMRRSEAVSAQMTAATANYWTPERRAAAIPRDLLIDPASVPASSALPTVGAPQVNSPGAPPKASVSGAEAAAGASTQALAAAEDYWTPAARASAIPREIDAEAAVAGEATRTEGAAIEPLGYTYVYPFTQYPVWAAAYWSPRLYPHTTIGKLFFTLNGTNYVCSASVIRPHLLLTARHCIFNYVEPSGGQFATNVVFYPGYFNGQANAALGGAWFARYLYTWVANAPNFRYDIGFIQLYDDNNTGCGGSSGTNPIENFTGYLGYSYGGSYEKRHWDEFGYPQGAPFTGNFLIQSESSTGALNVFGQTDTVEVGNSQTGGTSGGPWILGFRSTNYANGVNSYRWTNPNHAQAINSPQFHQYNFFNLLTGALAISCP
jgi:V8-like Glu-specific endopeptidase